MNTAGDSPSPPLADTAAQQERTRAAWEAFVSGVPVQAINLDGIPPHVLEGWQISRQHGIDPHKPPAPPVLKGRALLRKRLKHMAVLEAAEPMLKMLEVSIRNTGYIATLMASSGYLLEVVGDDDLMRQAHEAFNVPGALRDIKTVGASALSMCVLKRQPIQLMGYEHYIELFHSWACAGAPIFGEDNEPVASLTISGHISCKDRHTLALVKSCAEVITIRLREKHLLLSQRRLNSMLVSVYNSLPEAIIAIGNDGVITHTNSKVSNFSQSPESLEHKPLEAIINPVDVQRVMDIVSFRRPETCDISMLTPQGAQNCICRFTPIYLDPHTSGGMLLSISTRDQMIDLARHVSGNYAKYTFSDIKGRNKALHLQIDLAKRAAKTNTRVLITGESGTGKELFAQSIHNHSAARNQPFVAISCAAIPRDLIESELFGYVGGAFTGARVKGMVGKMELAAEGTLFLDEVNSLPLDMQAKLLRALQQKEITRIGDTKPTPIRARIITATNKDLMESIRQGSFREDLYYRLNVVEITIPPLRERRDDIQELVSIMLHRQCAESGLPTPFIDPDCMAALMDYPWPGNVRELDNVCERALLLAEDNRITLRQLPPHIRAYARNTADLPPEAAPLRPMELRASAPEADRQSPAPREDVPQGNALAGTYRALIEEALECSGGNLSMAARRLGVARSTLYRKLHQFGIVLDKLNREDG